MDKEGYVRGGLPSRGASAACPVSGPRPRAMPALCGHASLTCLPPPCLCYAGACLGGAVHRLERRSARPPGPAPRAVLPARALAGAAGPCPPPAAGGGPRPAAQGQVGGVGAGTLLLEERGKILLGLGHGQKQGDACDQTAGSGASDPLAGASDGRGPSRALPAWLLHCLRSFLRGSMDGCRCWSSGLGGGKRTGWRRSRYVRTRLAITKTSRIIQLVVGQPSGLVSDRGGPVRAVQAAAPLRMVLHQCTTCVTPLAAMRAGP